MFSNKELIFSSAGSVRALNAGGGPMQRRASSAALNSQKEQAFFGGLSGFGAGFGGSVNLNASGPMTNITMLTGLIAQTEDQLRKYYRDIYYYDSVAGSACDMVSTFPYGEFSLTGVPTELRDKYLESMVRLNIRQLMPQITLSYLVEGAYCGSLLFDTKNKMFIDVLHHDLDNCDITETPFGATQPMITATLDSKVREFLQSDSRQAAAMKARLGPALIKTMMSNALELDPITTLYVARQTMGGKSPVSWLKRLIPIYMLEKTLFRGTIVEAMRRQRAMLHVQMGDDTHEYTPDEMLETVNQFQLADLDPLGAIVGTRNNVQVSEVRSAGDFWRWDQTSDAMVPQKLRALGISEAFLSGDSNYSNVETGMSVFLENTDALRSLMTYQVLTDKVLPITAVSNKFFKDGHTVDVKSNNALHYEAEDHSSLKIPTVRWHKSLEVREEENMMDSLEKLSEKGFPIPLRMWAAASKVDVNNMIEDLRADEELRKELEEASGKTIQTVQPPSGGDSGGEMDWDNELASLSRPIRRRPLLSRTFNEADSEIAGTTKTGKRKYMMNQQKAQREMNEKIVAAASALFNDPHQRASAAKRVRERLGRMPKIL